MVRLWTIPNNLLSITQSVWARAKDLSDLNDQQEDPFCGKQAVRRNRKEKIFKNGHLYCLFV